MNTKQSFRLFIYCSVLLHLLVGVFYYYKKNPDSFPFFKTSSPIVSGDSLIPLRESSPPPPPSLEENSKESPSPAEIKKPSLPLEASGKPSASETEVEFVEVKSPLTDSSKTEKQESLEVQEKSELRDTQSDSPSAALNKVDELTEVEKEEISLPEEEVEKIGKPLEVKEEAVVAETENAAHFSEKIDHSKELPEGTESEPENKITETAEIKTRKIPLQDEVKDPLQAKEELGLTEVEKEEITSPEDIEEITSPEDIEEITSPEDIEEITSPEDIEEITSPEDIEEITSPEDIEEIEEPLEGKEDILEVKEIEIDVPEEGEENIEGFQKTPAETEKPIEDLKAVKAASDISKKQTPSSETEVSANESETSLLFRNFLSLKQRSGNPSLTYPLKARQMKAQGSLSLIFYVTAEGLVEKIQLETSSGHKELDNSVMRTFARYKFLPQQQGWVRHKVDFILNGEKVEFLKLRDK